jgi:hypothetical protein
LDGFKNPFIADEIMPGSIVTVRSVSRYAEERGMEVDKEYTVRQLFPCEDDGHGWKCNQFRSITLVELPELYHYPIPTDWFTIIESSREDKFSIVEESRKR